jgi:CDP-ribitol ribitolphosphotransferase
VTQDKIVQDAIGARLTSASTPLNFQWRDSEWERVNLKVTLSPTSDSTGVSTHASGLDELDYPELSDLLVKTPNLTELFLVAGKRAYPLKASLTDGIPSEFTVNVTNFLDRKRIPTGTFKLLPVINGELHPYVGIAMKDVPSLESAGRTFQYNGNKSAYAVTFGITEDDVRPVLLLRSYQYATSGGGKKRSLNPLTIARKIKNKLVGQKRQEKVRKLNPPTGSRLLFASEARTSLGGNLMAIHNKIEERGLNFDIRYSFSVPSTRTHKSRLRTIYLIATSDVVVLDDYFSMLGWLKVSKDTVIVQAWHAGSGFKNVGYSRFGKYGSPKLENAHRKYTYCIAGSSHLVDVYAEAFGIERESVIPTGLPRVDDFLDEQNISNFRESFYAEHPQLAGKKLVLFAPTFRGRGITTAFYPYDQIDFDALAEYCGDDTVVLFRMHHFIKEQIPIPEQYRDKFLDFTHFPDGLSLLHVIDIMITDYSSIIYEYSMLERPILFYSYDREVYEATRGFHRDYKETAPGKVCDTFDELITALKTEDYELDRVAAFRKENFDNIDRNSSDRFVDWILLKHLTPKAK